MSAATTVEAGPATKMYCRLRAPVVGIVGESVLGVVREMAGDGETDRLAQIPEGAAEDDSGLGAVGAAVLGPAAVLRQIAEIGAAAEIPVADLRIVLHERRED